MHAYNVLGGNLSIPGDKPMRTALSLTLLLIASPSALDAQQKAKPKTFTNSIDMKFAWVPPGTFMMGSPKDEKDRKDVETQHKVTLTKGFYMGVHLVTKEQWQAVMGELPVQDRPKKKNLPV